jgi:hypothetical protein
MPAAWPPLAPPRPARQAVRGPSPGSAPRSRAAPGSSSRASHDAELVEKVWGADLRVEGVVVEMLDGVDDLGRRSGLRPTGGGMGVLVDHLVPGTKESAGRGAGPGGPSLRRARPVVGHPYVDVWQSVKPSRLGMDAWPVIPRGTSWKVGIATHLGWPHSTQRDLAMAWRQILSSLC